MIVPVSLETSNSRIRLSQGGMVTLLVCVAIFANVSALRQVAERRREIEFREEMARNLEQLTVVLDELAKRKPHEERARALRDSMRP